MRILIKKSILILAVVSTLLIGGKNSFASKTNLSYGNLRGKVSLEKEAEFIESDRKYLTDKDYSKDIDQELEELERELSTVKDDYIRTSNNIKIYTGNTALKNNALRTAIINRKNFRCNSNGFKYDTRSKYMLGRDYERELRVRKTYDQNQMDQCLNLLVEILENLDINMDFLQDTSFVISPYSIDGINGYTMTKSNGDSLIVISSQDILAPKNFIDRSIKSTILHELGHVFLNKNYEELREVCLEIEQDITVRADDLDQWEKSPRENFAEDFRIFASSRLGDKSFKPMKKKTLLDTNQEEFMDIMDSILK